MPDPVQSSFRALADPTRREIIAILSKEQQTIAQLTGHFDMTRAAVKKHLTVLSDGGLITMEQQGRECINRLSPGGMKPVLDWLSYFDQFWNSRLENLKEAIERNDT